MASKTALIVDDSTSVRQMLTFVLKKGGFDVVEAANGREGLAQAELKKPNLVITDLNMPIMDGIEFIKHLRALPSTKYVPVLMVTTESQADKRQAGKAAGATGWIVKPFQPDQLLQVISKVLPQ